MKPQTTHRFSPVLSVSLAALLLAGCAAKADSTNATAPDSPSGPDESASPAPDSSASGSAAFEGSYSTKPKGVLKSVDEVKRWNEGVASLEETLADLDEKCGGVKPAVDIDYQSFAAALGGDLPSISHVLGHCQAVISGVNSQCGWKDDVLESAIRANLKRVLCEFDANADRSVILSWTDGVFRAGYSKISTNVHNDSTQWVTKNIPPAP